MAAAIDVGGLLRPSARVLVGVSGGMDSVVLLHALTAVAQQIGRGYSLIVAHMDHGIRETSAADAEFVADLAKQLNVPCVVERADVPALARRQGQGVEQAARTARYDFFARVAAQHHADAVAAAHHADDNVETILFRILRGTAMRGLRGMEAKRELRIVDCGLRIEEGGGSGKLAAGLQSVPQSPVPSPQSRVPSPQSPIFLIRPLLGFRRDEIHAYAQAANLAWREDHTNDDVRYRRNFLRHELLPLVREKLNDQADDAILRLGELAAQTEVFLTCQAERRLAESVSHEDAEKILLDVTMFTPNPADETEAILRTTAYRLILDRLGMPQRDMTAEHLAAIDALLRTAGGVVNLPDGVIVRREKIHLLFQTSR